MTKTLKDRLLEEIERLPEDRLHEVLDFIECLRTKNMKEAGAGLPESLDPQKDPILKLIGIADVEPFSQNIDEELYGE